MRTIAIIQARMGSSRLSGKVLKPILGKPMLWHIVERVRATPSISEVIVATPDSSDNEILRRFCTENEIACFAGSELDVLDRFYRAAQVMKGDPVLRITGDCPLADPQLIEKVIQMQQAGAYDHVGVAAGAGAQRINRGRFPDGMDAECIAFTALERAWRESTDSRDREHVTRYIWNNQQMFRCDSVTSDRTYPSLRLTVDHPEDFELVTRIYESLYDERRHFLLEDVMRFLDNNPGLLELNRKRAETEVYRNVLED